MDLKIGLVGLPNVGKSTIFNALLQKAKAEVANYPFCTIEPNVGLVSIPDERLEIIAQKEKSAKITPALIEFVDIAGLVRGASKGAGLGNQFLSHIRTVSAIAYVLRCFEDENIVHVEGTVNPVRDLEILEIELILADLQSIERREEKVSKHAKADRDAKRELDILNKAKSILEDLRPLRAKRNDFTPEEWFYLERTLFLLTIKPVMFVANIDEKYLRNPLDSPHYRALLERADLEGSPVVHICGKIEAELAGIPEEEKRAFMDLYGLKEPGLHNMIREGFKLLDLITFFTAGPKEAKAWPIKRGTTAKRAAGEIHSDMEKGFICAEVLSFDDYLRAETWQKAKEMGLVRLEGRDYIIQDGDILYIRFNV